MASIRFRAEVGVDEELEQHFDVEYFGYQLNADNITFSIPTATYVTMEFDVDFDEVDISEEDMWYNIQGEFDRPYRID